MLIKYIHRDDSIPMLTSVADVFMSENNIIFRPTRDDIEEIVILGPSITQYERIIAELYENGKVDLSDYHSDTCFMSETD